MRSCTKMIDTGRRKFLSGAGLAAAGVAAATVVPTPAESAPARARVDYPPYRLANVRDLKPTTSFYTAGCPTCCSEGGNHGLQTSDRPPPDRPEGRQGV
jgi:hypothetical protein